MFYSALTQHLGFPHYGDEYKVMGLAPYGEPTMLDKMRQIVLLKSDGTFELNLDCFRHHKEKVPYVWDNGSPEVGTLFAEGLEDLIGPARKKDEPMDQRHRDLARSVQAMYEEAFFHLLKALHARHGLDAGPAGLLGTRRDPLLDQPQWRDALHPPPGTAAPADL
jgi:carbamoyltransferase